MEKNPNSVLGKPGPLQGLNTGRDSLSLAKLDLKSGVVLFDLEKMRRSRMLSLYLQPHRWEGCSNLKVVPRAAELMAKFGYPMMLGDQDWFTNLQWDQPMLVHILPCRFNAQV